jgi:demethoxyubiquinone hydroxylase (CLK1/Coq7/Cat5 family)
VSGFLSRVEEGAMDTSRSRLIQILQLAYSGELAAGYAYRGHARSVSDASERDRIRQIRA